MPRSSFVSTIFDFVWAPQDELMALKPPQRYGRVEIALPDKVVDGVIERIMDTFDHPDREGVTCYLLRISTSADLSLIADENGQVSDIAVRVCG